MSRALHVTLRVTVTRAWKVVPSLSGGRTTDLDNWTS